jgi:hypothetical protein
MLDSLITSGFSWIAKNLGNKYTVTASLVPNSSTAIDLASFAK